MSTMGEEVWRLVQECPGAGSELLTAGLAGREKNVENLCKLWTLVCLAYGTGAFDPPWCRWGGRKWKRAIEEYLLSVGTSAEEIERFFNPDPVPGFKSILDEMGEE